MRVDLKEEPLVVHQGELGATRNLEEEEAASPMLNICHEMLSVTYYLGKQKAQFPTHGRRDNN